MDINKIYCGDAVEVMKTFPNEYIDLVVTSPPSTIDFESTANQIYRVMKTGGVVVWVVENSDQSMRQALYFKDVGFFIHDTMVCQKIPIYPTPPDAFSQAFEFMSIISKNEQPKTARLLCDKKNRWAGTMPFGTSTQRRVDGELIPCRRKKPVAEYSPRDNIWFYSPDKVEHVDGAVSFEYPKGLPTLLPFDHIRTWSVEGDVVLDPFCREGITCLMAKILSRQYIGIDISPEYCHIAERRLTNSHIYNVEKMIEISKEVYNSRYRQNAVTDGKNK